MSSLTTIKVRGYHLDIYGHVNNARYLEFFEEARWEFFERLDMVRLMEEAQQAFVLVNTNVTYKLPGIVGDVFDIETRIDDLGTKSCKVGQTIRSRKSGKVVTEGVFTFCLIDIKTNMPIPFEGIMRDELERMIEYAASQAKKAETAEA